MILGQKKSYIITQRRSGRSFSLGVGLTWTDPVTYRTIWNQVMSRDTVAMKSMDSEKVRVQREHCDPAIIAATLVGPKVGAIVTFTGTVKKVTKQGTVERIEFSADEPVALAQMEALNLNTLADLERFRKWSGGESEFNNWSSVSK